MAEGRWDSFTSENEKGEEDGEDGSNNERFMTGIVSRRGFYQPIINRIAPRWGVAHIYSVQLSLCFVSPLTPFPDQWPPLPSPYITWLFQPHLLPFSFFPSTVFTHLSPFPPCSSSSLWLCVSCSFAPLASLFHQLIIFFSALLLSLSPSSPHRSLLPLAAGEFSVYFAYAVCYPHSLPV